MFRIKKIFEQGYFNSYANVELAEARNVDIKHSQLYGKTTVFISHKYENLNDLKGLLGYLEHEYGVKVYIDSQDPKMPKTTSGETAQNIKERIKQCDKFILLATNEAIESKWCNWELGFGDAHKYRDNIALFPIKPKGSFDFEYKGNEYMLIYPYICYFNGSEKYADGRLVKSGYYVRYHENGKNIITPLKEWLVK